MGTTSKAVIMPTEIGNGDQYEKDKPAQSPGRGSRQDGTSQVPDKQLDIRDR